jgi:hypothetical protein
MRHWLVSTVAALALVAPVVARAQSGATPGPSGAAGPVAPTATTAATTPAAGAVTPAAPSAATTSAGPAPGTPAPRSLEVTQVTVPGVNIRAARVSTEFNAPFEVVSRVVLDFPAYHEFLPQVRESRVVQRRRGQQDVYLGVPLLDGFPGLWALDRFDIQRGPNNVVVDGHMVNGNMTRADVRIEATAVPGTNRTQVTLQVLGIPSFPLPTGFLNVQQGRWGSRGLTAMRDRAEHVAGLAAIAPGVAPAASHPHPAATTQRPDSGGGPGPAHD